MILLQRREYNQLEIERFPLWIYTMIKPTLSISALYSAIIMSCDEEDSVDPSWPIRCVTCLIVSTINALFLLAFLFLLLFPCLSYFIYICCAYIYILLNSLFYLYTAFERSKCRARVSVFILRLNPQFYVFNNYSILAVFSYCWKLSYVLAWKIGLGGSLQ